MFLVSPIIILGDNTFHILIKIKTFSTKSLNYKGMLASLVLITYANAKLACLKFGCEKFPYQSHWCQLYS